MNEEDRYVTIKVFRYDPSVDKEPHYDSFRVRYDEEETILGVLKYIVEHDDPSLAFRESCRIGNCGICTIKVNGKGVLACREILKNFDTPEMVLEPFHQDRVIRDLVCHM